MGLSDREFSERLKSYESATGWFPAYATGWAHAGFFLISLDQVQCRVCSLVLKVINVSCQPMYWHERHSPTCPFVLNMKGSSDCNPGLPLFSSSHQHA